MRRQFGTRIMMRTWIASLLMATTLAPVAASAQDAGGGRDGRRGEWSRMRGDAGQMDRGRREVAPRDQARPQPQPQPQPQPAAQARYDQPRNQPRLDQQRPDQPRRDRPNWGNDQRAGRGDEGRYGMDQRYPRGQNAIGEQPRPDGDRRGWRDRGQDRGQVDGDRGTRRPDRDGRPDIVGSDRDRRDTIRQGDDRRNGWRNDDRRDWNNDRRPDQQRRAYGYGYGGNNGWRDQAYDRSRFEDRRAWNRGWRTENRYDWTRYRSTNRNAYRLPRYYAPYGWSSYRRLSIGLSLAPQLWGQNYWIADPWSYRLPDAYGQYRWVRYYDDALLVDLDSGQVVDAVYGIFW